MKLFGAFTRLLAMLARISFNYFNSCTIKLEKLTFHQKHVKHGTNLIHSALIQLFTNKIDDFFPLKAEKFLSKCRQNFIK